MTWRGVLLKNVRANRTMHDDGLERALRKTGHTDATPSALSSLLRFQVAHGFVWLRTRGNPLSLFEIIQQHQRLFPARLGNIWALKHPSQVIFDSPSLQVAH